MAAKGQGQVSMETNGQRSGDSVSLKLEHLNMASKGEDCTDLVKNIQTLSPTTQESLGILLNSISKGEAQIDVDAEGKPFVDYRNTRKILWDGSNANVIAEPKSDLDIQVKVDACLELIGYFKSEKPPSGVNLDKTKISLSPRKQYREGHEFVKTKRILGSGNSAGDILVVKDMKTGHEHAQKTMMISVFRKEEIRCWVDMSDSGCVPSFYLFKVEDNKIAIHMEILKNAKTLRSIIDDEMGSFYGKPHFDLRKPFSLFVLDGALGAVADLINTGWTHNDLHAGNVMLQNTTTDKLKVKIIDFGMASPLETQFAGLNSRGFKADICEVLRIFTGLYTGQEFDNKLDIKRNYKGKMWEMSELLQMSIDDRRELFCLVDAAMKVVHPDDLFKYRQLVRDKLIDAMDEAGGHNHVMKKVAAILFPESFKPVHAPQNQDAPDSVGGGDVADCVTHRHGNSYHDNTDLDLDTAANQITDDDLEQIRRSLGVNLI